LFFQPLAEETGMYLSTSTFIAKIHGLPHGFSAELKEDCEIKKLF